MRKIFDLLCGIVIEVKNNKRLGNLPGRFLRGFRYSRCWRVGLGKTMNSYRCSRSYENLERRIFEGVGPFGIPELKATQLDCECEFIGFNNASKCRDRQDKGVHFFLDDYQFNRLWTSIDRYVPMLAQFRYVMTPDFSLYTDFPKAIQIYNHYRKHWVGAYLQDAGVKVIPTITWSTPDSYEWCFDGEPTGGTVAVSSVGCLNSKTRKALFLSGYQEMLDRLCPDTVLFYGNVPTECGGNIIHLRSFQEEMREVRCNGR